MALLLHSPTDRYRQPTAPLVASEYQSGLVSLGFTTQSLQGPAWSTFGTAPTDGYSAQLGRHVLTSPSAYGGLTVQPAGVQCYASQAYLFHGFVTAYTGAWAGLLTVADAAGSINSVTFQRSSDNTRWSLFVASSEVANTPTDPLLNRGPVTVLLQSDATQGVEVWVSGTRFLAHWSTASAYASCRLVLFGERGAGAANAIRGGCALRAYWANRSFSQTRASELTRNPWRIFAERPRVYFTSDAPTTQLARPASDVAAGEWLASSGNDLYAMLDETVAADADYVYTEAPMGRCKVRFSVVTSPTAGTRTLAYRARAPYGGSVQMSLYHGSTLIEEWTQALSTTLADYSHTPVGTVPDWAALDLWMTASPP